MGFQALAHWIWRPGDQEDHHGSFGWRHRMEVEASTVGFLALAPWQAGPPYPGLSRAHIDGDVTRFWVRYPSREPGGTVRWTTKAAELQRFARQLEFEW